MNIPTKNPAAPSLLLTHYSAKPLKFNPTRRYKSPSPTEYKPVGFWLSDERTDQHGWREWAESEQFQLERLKSFLDFRCDLTRWCVLSTREDILAFTRQYKRQKPELPFSSSISIDWVRVQREFAGIVITPYQWELRHHKETFWYYGWDCASACVWDLSTIEPVPIQKVLGKKTTMELPLTP